MAGANISCPRCRTGIAIAEDTSTTRILSCGACGESLEVSTFPALWRRAVVGRVGERITGDEAACYVHTDRRAERACDRCGRFMCALCEVGVGSEHLCAACFEAGRRERKLVQVERQRMVYPALAVRLVLFALLLGPLAIGLCLPAVALALWGLIRPTSVTGRRYVGAAIFAIAAGGAQTFLWSLWWTRLFLR